MIYVLYIYEFMVSYMLIFLIIIMIIITTTPTITITITIIIIIIIVQCIQLAVCNLVDLKSPSPFWFWSTEPHIGSPGSPAQAGLVFHQWIGSRELLQENPMILM